MRKFRCTIVGEPLNHIHQDTKSARLIAVCKRSFKEWSSRWKTNGGQKSQTQDGKYQKNQPWRSLELCTTMERETQILKFINSYYIVVSCRSWTLASSCMFPSLFSLCCFKYPRLLKTAWCLYIRAYIFTSFGHDGMEIAWFVSL